MLVTSGVLTMTVIGVGDINQCRIVDCEMVRIMKETRWGVLLYR